MVICGRGADGRRAPAGAGCGARIAIAAASPLPLLPLLGNSMGWIMTEMGRQPWLVYGQMKTAAGVSANSAGEVLASLIVFTLLYGVLAVIEGGLMLKSIKAGLTDEPLPSRPRARRPAVPATGPDGGGTAPDTPMQLVY